MAAAIAAVPTSGTHLSTVFQVNITGASSNTTTGYDPTAYPAEPAVTYYAKFARTGSQTLKSPVFSTNAEGKASWLNVILPDAGTWTLTLNATSDDSVIATASVVAS